MRRYWIRRRRQRCRFVVMSQYAVGGRMAGGQHLWRKTFAKADRWADFGASGYEEREIRFGILDPPSVPFIAGTILHDIPQTEEDLEFGKENLSSECMSGIYEEISRDQAEAVVADGNMMSSAFTVWHGDGLGGREDL
jgi:hypothetical protein